MANVQIFGLQLENFFEAYSSGLKDKYVLFLYDVDSVISDINNPFIHSNMMDQKTYEDEVEGNEYVAIAFESFEDALKFTAYLDREMITEYCLYKDGEELSVDDADEEPF